MKRITDRNGDFGHPEDIPDYIFDQISLHRKRIFDMQRIEELAPVADKAPTPASPVKAVINWVIETEREFRATQKLIDKTRDRS
ncbi:hypothetical protein [Roseobacter weihaiensis]|uniref:hypothetical protein n=1 Tax=Roseobacter weihaiensis TaxID=2763262 RepID=UPI001D0B2E6C|nr:hypothetical protein [Roseobacter sp. H9]